MRRKLKYIFRNYFEITTFAVGLILMATLDPNTSYNSTWCLFEIAGIGFCPGEGLGHSIAYFFRGDLYNSLQANLLGPFAIVVLIGRICYLLNINFRGNLKKEKGQKLWQE